MTAKPNVRTLVLDAGPLLSLSPLRGLAERYVTVPQVVAELKDPRVRDHLERLELTGGIKLEVLDPDVASLAKVTALSKKTGDYSVLSVADLRILALTCSLHEKAQTSTEVHVSSSEPTQPPVQGNPASPETHLEEQEAVDESFPDEETAPEFERVPLDADAKPQPEENPSLAPPLYQDPPSDDDGQGEWITPDNIAKHKSRALQALPAVNPKRDQDTRTMTVGCMTFDYAMQNVLLHMNLNLVGAQGRRIASVKSWVLRCHACFKICKDNTKKFCPTCGNATLLRTSVTTSAPGADGSEPVVQIHLKKNFQYKNRGTKYSLHLPKPGAAKGGAGSTNIILREDQVEFQKGLHQETVRQRKEQKRVERALTQGKGSGMNWDDPDWIPEILTGTRRSTGGLPVIGHGRRNPNEIRRKHK
ncbi:20S-pre-rRNA D-site endonuclease nob1 [Ceratobasidium theobromae]|uniref:20S-pre-rRNA D-site endonuclease NOB1 n=1 Tax=Ceratobasidium theobromae TaxID=1582974 RepID=A0A5N5QRH9_9AGAM|nr:20S-pre-rRNA D-site endonuclease nob1 [Ceratobasidium theobromae]